MKIRVQSQRGLLAFAVFALCSVPAFAQQPEATKPAVEAVQPAAPSQADIDEGKKILDATIKAHGGDAFKNLKTLKLSGKGELTGPPGSPIDGQLIPVSQLIISSSAPDKSRMDIITDFFTAAFVNYGADQGGHMEIASEISPTKPDATSANDPTQLLRTVANNPKYVVAAVEEKDKDGKALTAIDGKALKSFVVINPAGRRSVFSVEADTSLVRRISGKGPQGGDSITTFSEYKEFSGVQLPTKMVLRTQGVDLLKVTFDKVDLNTGVEDKLFEKVK